MTYPLLHPEDIRHPDYRDHFECDEHPEYKECSLCGLNTPISDFSDQFECCIWCTHYNELFDYCNNLGLDYHLLDRETIQKLIESLREA